VKEQKISPVEKKKSETVTLKKIILGAKFSSSRSRKKIVKYQFSLI